MLFSINQIIKTNKKNLVNIITLKLVYLKLNYINHRDNNSLKTQTNNVLIVTNSRKSNQGFNQGFTKGFNKGDNRGGFRLQF